MRWRLGRIVVLVLVAVLALGGMAWAQEEGVTLERLAEMVEAMEARVGALEGIFAEVGPVEAYENGCLIGIDRYAANELDLQTLRDETVLKYKEQYGKWLQLDDVRIQTILYNAETGRLGISYLAGYSDSGPFVVEEWDGCEFVGSSDWWEE